ncbi:MAG TPA: thioredoxin domain-containing protein [Nannocystaceae bacterium]|nr:thioredoxin domain-containing protein [Nannocystaceae bacterium]
MASDDDEGAKTKAEVEPATATDGEPSSEAAPRAAAPAGRAEAADAGGEGGPPAKRRGSPIAGILGFIAALGGGFFIGQWINNRRSTPEIAIEDGPRYKVELRGDEPRQGPDDALVTIIEFADYQCPYCAKAAGPMMDAVEDFDDDVRIVFKHYPLNSHDKAIPAARAAWAAHQQGKFWPFHEWLFESKADLAGLEKQITKLGLDRQQFLTDAASDASAQSVDADFLAGAKVGVTGTPAFFVNGHRYKGLIGASDWHEIIEAELVQAERLRDAGTPRAQVYDALLEGAIELDTAKSKRRPGEPDPAATYRVTVDDRPALGPADALVTVVFFSDFQCPFCSRVAPVAHELVEKHPDVRVVFRNLPLPMHARAREAAKAALAAGRQGKFWEMHDLLFAEQKALADADFAEMAGRLELDTTQFATDMADAELDRLVDEDESLAASFGVQSTPSAFVNGRFVSGARPLQGYETVIAEERVRAQALVDAGTAPADVYGRIMQDAATSVARESE